ncbi:MAG: Lrp/AsnC family transcriptional regulator [Chloroflexi bacterium]|nr:Lrp/AsnC family transcriptional regulator [Chloroflexota bacterium]MBP8059560.1 Lrp/AsnC family transcriptional regulator [Chloroflexota bacterium]
MDRAVLELLQQDARITQTDLARQVDISPTGLQKRIRKLEEDGIIERYATILNKEKLGYDMLCFVQVTLQRHNSEAVENFRHAVQTMPEVLECHHLTGEYDYLLKIIVYNRKHLERFLLEILTPLPGMDKIRTSLVLSEIKATTVVPLNGY